MSGQRNSRQRAEPSSEVRHFGYYPLNCFRNVWYDCFLNHHDLAKKDDKPALEIRRNLGCVEGELEILLRTSDNSGSASKADGVKRYCKDGPSLDAIQNGIGESGSRRTAWVDDRNSPHLAGIGNVRLSGTWMTATGLLRHLKQFRYELEDQPDAERRLIHISDLTPDMIHVLAATATAFQIPVLRDAICKHVSFRSSIRVQIPSDGFPSFQMEFHLPFFALRSTTQPNSLPSDVPGTLLRKYENLTFLRHDQSDSAKQEEYRLQESQISCIVHGCGEWQWTCYSFVDNREENEPEDEVNESEDEINESEDEINEAIHSQHNIVDATFDIDDEDPILLLLDSKKQPIWRPRQYFLKAFEVQVRKFRTEWITLVDGLEDDRTEYIRQHPVTSSDSPQGNRPAEELSTAFHWTRQRMDLVTKLQCVLSGTMREWNAFISLDGSVGYFSDLDELPPDAGRFGPAGQSLRSIKHTFGELENVQQSLISLRESLARDFSMLKILLSLEGNAATENSAFIAKFTTWVLYPYFLAAGMFSMQPTVIPFELKFHWFVISMVMLMFAMFVIQYLMKRWTLWKNQATLWMKMRELEEEKEEEVEEGLSA